MVNLVGKPLWSDVRLLESHEYAQGGENGNMNEQAKALVNRTEYLKGVLEQLQQALQSQQDWQMQVAEQLTQIYSKLQQRPIICTNAALTFKCHTGLDNLIKVSIDDGPWIDLSAANDALNITYYPVDIGATLTISPLDENSEMKIRLKSDKPLFLYVNPTIGVDDIAQQNQSYCLYDLNGEQIDPTLSKYRDYSGQYLDDTSTNQDYVVAFHQVSFCLSNSSGGTINPPHDLTFDQATGQFSCWVDQAFTSVFYQVYQIDTVIMEGETGNSGDGMMCSAFINLNFANGDYFIQAWIVDEDGNRSANAILNFKVAK